MADLNEIKCPNCGAPIVNGKCNYCNYVSPTKMVNNQPQRQAQQRDRARNQATQSPPIRSMPQHSNTNAYRRNPNMQPNMQRPKKKHTGLKIFGGILVFLFIVGMFSGESSTNSSEKTSSSVAENNSIWARDYTDISEFEYYLDGEELYIKDYKGRDKKVRINSTYEIDGKERHVVALVDGTFALHRVESVIVPDGTKTLENNTFNSCGVKFLYLPPSIEPLSASFWSYFHDVQKIYYGGTEEQWNTICDVNRGDIDVTEIVYEAKEEDLN